MARMDRISQLEEAQEKGEKKGEEKGMLRLGALIQLLLKDGRTDEIQAATTDPTIRNQLFRKYNV